MLLSLHIENIAIIDKSDIDFCDGFNVLTGETGAGKSIIIDSIALLTGVKKLKGTYRVLRFSCDCQCCLYGSYRRSEGRAFSAWDNSR